MMLRMPKRFAAASVAASQRVRYYHRANELDRLILLFFTLCCIGMVAHQAVPSPSSLRLVEHTKQRRQQQPHHQHQHQLALGAKTSHSLKKRTAAAAAASETTTTTTTTITTATQQKKSLWKNKYNVVHVLWTRFMQLQPDLISLGKARIELFKTFTLRSMGEQSTQEFLWIIMTDPELEAELVDEMMKLVQIHPNILLVGMNTGGVLDFRGSGWMGALETIFSGDRQLLLDYQQASLSRVYVESRIDADDAMHQEFMETVQKQAFHSLGDNNKEQKITPPQQPFPAAVNVNDKDDNNGKANKNTTTTTTDEFRVFCPEHHLEWGYFNPWQKESNRGHLFGITSSEFCITAGLTYAFQVGTKPNSIKIPHHFLHKRLPRCSSSSNLTTTKTKKNAENEHNKLDTIPRSSSGRNNNCVDRIDAGHYKYLILRSRTPTSAGMAGVIPSKHVTDSKEWALQQEHAWNTYMYRNFGITPKSIWALREYLSLHMEAILQDALEGQCTRADFTCKPSSQQDLKKLLLQVKQHSTSNNSTTSEMLQRQQQQQS